MTLMEYAELEAQKAQCKRAKVGAVIVKNGIIIGMGYNIGDCNGCDLSQSCKKTIHAEMLALQNATEPVDGAYVYVTHYPCDNCSDALHKAGIQKLFYKEPYKIYKRTNTTLWKTLYIKSLHELL